MRRRLLHLWDQLAASYWFVPAAMLLGSIALSVLTLWLDYQIVDDEHIGWFLYAGGAEATRNLLSTITGSTITVAGVVFSITMLTLTQASQQFGPRMLRNFMRDRANQMVLGTFVATYVYGILVMRSIDRVQQIAVPHVSVNVAVVLALASICVLVFFIHHVSNSIQAPHLVATVWSELDAAI